MELCEERREARAYLEEREVVSDTVYNGKVVSTTRGFSWVQLTTSLDAVPEGLHQQLKEMTAAVKKKAAKRASRNHAFALDSDVEYVVYVGALDLQGDQRSVKVGSKVQLKLYSDSKGVGGCDVAIVEEPEESQETHETQEKQDLPAPLVPGRVDKERSTGEILPPRPRYMKDFEAKVAEEERNTLDGVYEGEVVQRSKMYAWIKPHNLSAMPADVQHKLQEMCDGFRKKAEEGAGRPFCGGIEDNVVYVANPDLSVKGAILCVGMKVTFKLYTDNKGVGGYDVVPSEEHIQKMRDAIRNNFKTDEGKKKTLHWSSIFGQGEDAFKDVLFVGECTHEFSLAVGRLCGLLPRVDQAESLFTLGNSSWCSTELQWPRAFERNLELQLAGNLKKLRSIGVWCSEAVDAHRMKQTLQKTQSPCVSFETVFWMMPYVPDGRWRPPASIAPLMFYCIEAFVQSALDVCKEDGAIMVVVTSAQCLSWNLYQCRPKVGDNEIVPDVRWFDVSEYEEHGYQSRFGDGRDRFVDKPVFHSLCDMVAVRWRPKIAEPQSSQLQTTVEGVTEEEIELRKKQIEEVGKEPHYAGEGFT